MNDPIMKILRVRAHDLEVRLGNHNVLYGEDRSAVIRELSSYVQAIALDRIAGSLERLETKITEEIEGE